jgi:serine/threonine protein kinase
LESLSNEVFEEYLIKKTKNAKGAEQFENETKLLTFLKSSFHPYIAEYYCKLEEVPFKSESLYVMHYNESLGSVRQKISTDKKIEMAYQIAKVLTFLSYRKICHRDLKMDNIMVDNSLNPKVIDWGSVCPMYGP